MLNRRKFVSLLTITPMLVAFGKASFGKNAPSREAHEKSNTMLIYRDDSSYKVGFIFTNQYSFEDGVWNGAILTATWSISDKNFDLVTHIVDFCKKQDIRNISYAVVDEISHKNIDFSKWTFDFPLLVNETAFSLNKRGVLK